MDLIDALSQKPLSKEEIAMKFASGDKSAFPSALQLVASDPNTYNITNFTKFLKSMTGISKSRKRYYGRIKKQSTRIIRNDRRSKKLK
jgi:hypothetical protein